MSGESPPDLQALAEETPVLRGSFGQSPAGIGGARLRSQQFLRAAQPRDEKLPILQ